MFSPVFFVQFRPYFLAYVNSLNAELNPICHLLALLGAHHILHGSRERVKVYLRTHYYYYYSVLSSYVIFITTFRSAWPSSGIINHKTL